MPKSAKILMAASLFFFEFDVAVGPQLARSVTVREFSSSEMESMRCCAFPETLRAAPKALFFTFKIGDDFCYTLYLTQADPEKPRGHVQTSFVIATKLPYYTPFMHFLLSAASIDAGEPRDVFDLVGEFLKKWIDKIPSQPKETIELPMLVGSLSVTCPSSERDVFNEVNTYIVNDGFADIDMCQTLEVANLVRIGRTGDILTLWEASVAGESVLVMGRNAHVASGAALTIASLRYPQKPDVHVLPYVPVTDPRFVQSMTGNSIVGLVNPLGLEYAGKFKHVLHVGFAEEKAGLSESRTIWDFLSNFGHITSKQIRRQLYINTLKLTRAIEKCFKLHCPVDPYGACAGSLGVDELESCFVEENLVTARGTREFSAAMLRSEMLLRICHECTSDPELISVIRRFSVCRLCSQLGDDDKVQLYSNIQDFKKYCVQSREMLELVDNHAQAVKLSLCPDLVFVD